MTADHLPDGGPDQLQQQETDDQHHGGYSQAEQESRKVLDEGIRHILCGFHGILQFVDHLGVDVRGRRYSFRKGRQIQKNPSFLRLDTLSEQFYPFFRPVAITGIRKAGEPEKSTLQAGAEQA